MKIYKTLLFIFCTLFLLALSCHFFPRDGVQIGSFKLQFPRLSEVLSLQKLDDAELEPEMTPEQLLEIRMQAVMAAQDSTFLDFCANSPIRISMPKIHIMIPDSVAMDSLRLLGDSTEVWIDSLTMDRDMAYLDSFFMSLDSAKVRHMRIVHYGDSQIEMDRISSSLREHFQEEFGGCGVGLLPAIQTVPKMTVSQSSSLDLPYYLVYGPASNRANHHGYGPMGMVSHLGGGSVTLSYRPQGADRFPHGCYFDKVTVLKSDASGQLVCDVQNLDSARASISVSVAGPTHIFGVMLDGKTGVSMDNIPMRGCSGSIFTSIDRKTLEPFFQHENVQMIILQYGGNSVPYLKTEKSIQIFVEALRKQIRYFKEIAPSAKILFIGPSDMSTTVGGGLATYPMLPRLVEVLEDGVTSEGAAFWNMFEAMGGVGSMIQWVKARPQLAGEDYIHFTPKGAQKVSDLLYETISTYYKYYKFRRGEVEFNLPTDSISIDSLLVDSLLFDSLIYTPATKL